MWPSKKDKGITIPPGGSIDIELGVEWKRGKDEVVIIADKEKFVLDGKKELFLEVTSSNANPIKVQIVPDFKKRVINIVEVINANTKYVEDKNRSKISFAGVSVSKDDTVSIDTFLKTLDENIETFGKRIHKYKARRNIFMIFAAIVIIGNIYLFTINNSPQKYLNAIVVVIMTYASFRLWNSYKDLCKAYEEYKEHRSKVFEVVKNN